MRLKRISLGLFPTPIYKLENLSKIQQCNIYIKRDDLTGLGLGGNKIRKLEFILADAISKKTDIVLTVGGTQSNHAFLTALCCKKLGLDVKLILGYTKEYDLQGNLLLEKIIDTDVLRVKTSDVFKLHEIMAEVASKLKKTGRRPYSIPVGGSDAIGARGYIVASKEILGQLKKQKIKINSLYCACGSGGTLAGLLLGKRIYKLSFDVIGIDVGAITTGVEEYVLDILNQAAEELELEKFKLRDINIDHNYIGEKYAKPTPRGIEAIKFLSRTEGIFLDPVYTSKAFAGMLDIIKKRKDKNILFLHTGGLPALFSYNKIFSNY